MCLVQGPANVELFEGLLMLQHRGQDSAGMVTFDGTRFCEHKDNGLVNDVFDPKTMNQLRGGCPGPSKLCWRSEAISKSQRLAESCSPAPHWMSRSLLEINQIGSF